MDVDAKNKALYKCAHQVRRLPMFVVEDRCQIHNASMKIQSIGLFL